MQDKTGAVSRHKVPGKIYKATISFPFESENNFFHVYLYGN
jgi:hypothetical protein